MSVTAYITAGATTIPVLLPDEEMRDTARQLDLKDSDLFCVDVPCGMTRHVRARVLIASTQVSALYASPTVTLVLQEEAGSSTITLSSLYARPQQPFFWREAGGVVMVDLVDERWYWKFTSAIQVTGTTSTPLAPLRSSDGRYLVNTTGSPTPITTTTELYSAITSAVAASGMTMPTGTITSGNIRRMSDLVASPNVSLALLLDTMAVTAQSVAISTGSGMAWKTISTLKSEYDTRMNAYKRAMRGGMQPVNGAAGGTDTLVGLWNATGFQARAPRKCNVVMPQRMIEGLTQYDNCPIPSMAAGQFHFNQTQMYQSTTTPSWTRQPNDKGFGYATEASVAVLNCTGSVLTSSPGWPVAAMATAVGAQYQSRYESVPFGRTVWAGWIPFYESSLTIGQIGNVSYRLAVVDGEWSPYTISECDEADWRFSLQGASEMEPANVVTAKGKAQVYRNCVGTSIIDVPPPNTRIFPAVITGNVVCSVNYPWRWFYSWEEVEPNPDQQDPDVKCSPGLDIQECARAGTLNARNMAEAANNYVGVNNPANVIAPGVYQQDYPTAIISARPIMNGTIVMMCEQMNVVNDPTNTGPQYWFSMPNAVFVECEPPQEFLVGPPEPI